MPIIQIEYLEGRASAEEKRILAQKVTDVVVECIGCPREAVSIIIREMRREDFAKGGKLASDW